MVASLKLIYFISLSLFVSEVLLLDFDGNSFFNIFKKFRTRNKARDKPSDDDESVLETRPGENPKVGNNLIDDQIEMMGDQTKLMNDVRESIYDKAEEEPISIKLDNLDSLVQNVLMQGESGSSTTKQTSAALSIKQNSITMSVMLSTEPTTSTTNAPSSANTAHMNSFILMLIVISVYIIHHNS